MRRGIGSCWGDGVCVEGGVWRRAQVEWFLSGWDRYLSGWDRHLSSWDRHLSDLRGAEAEVGGLRAEEVGEVFGDESGDVGRGWESALGFGAGAPSAKEVEDGAEEVAVGGGRRCGGGFVVLLQLVEGLGGIDQEAEGGEIDGLCFAGGFFAPEFGDALDAAARGCYGLLEFEGHGGDLDTAGEAELVHAEGQALAGGVVADLRIDGISAGGEPALDALDDLRDAAVVEHVLLGDFPLLEALDFDAFVDFEVAGCGGLFGARGAVVGESAVCCRGGGDGG